MCTGLLCKPLGQELWLISPATVAFCFRGPLPALSLLLSQVILKMASGFESPSRVEFLDDVFRQTCAEQQQGPEEDDKGKVLRMQ
jgi:hypothetical protein